jgi:zinc-ribbon domain
MTPSVDYPDPEPPPMPVIEAVAAPKATGPVDTPWERLDAQRTEIETVKPPEELVRPAGPPGIICPACRTENEASRRFCQSCGTPLVQTAPIQPIVQRTAKRSYRWLLVLIPIVIVAAVLGFGGAALLKGGLPAASSSAAPPGSLGPTAGTSGAPGSQAVGPTASPSSGPSVHGLALYRIISSGHRDEAHSSGKSIDYQRGSDSTKTEWQDNASGGRDIWIEVQFKLEGAPTSTPGPVDVSSITLFPGDQSSEANFKKTARPKIIRFSADGRAPVEFLLKDRFGSQELVFKDPVHVKKDFRITIVENYPGSASQFSGISEIRFVGVSSP